MDPVLGGKIGLADTGWVYVPTACTPTARCRVHVVFHGCKQYAGNPEVREAVYKNAGYNEWAATNKIIVVYPQTKPIVIDLLGLSPTLPDALKSAFTEISSEGCWDWWGLDGSLPRNSEFAQKTGHQILAIRKMLDRLAEGFVPGGGPSGNFGVPQHVSVADRTSTSLTLIWQPNNAATGFNVYRSPSRNGAYTKINNGGPVSGASFADQQLTPKTTYYYQVSAIDAANNESTRSNAVHKKTGSTPRACDPYYSSNPIHVLKLRAVVDVFNNTYAIDSTKIPPVGQPMGPDKADKYQHLIKDKWPLPVYHIHYCR